MFKLCPVKIIFVILTLLVPAVLAQVDVPRQTLAVTYPQDELV